MLARQKKLLNFILTKLKTRDGNDYGKLRDGIRDTLEVIHHVQTTLEKGFKENGGVANTLKKMTKNMNINRLEKTFKVIGKELEKGGNTIKKAFEAIGKELKTSCGLSCELEKGFKKNGGVGNTIKLGFEVIGKETKKAFEVIGKELEKQLKKAACFSGTSTVQTRRGGIEIKNTFNIQNTKLDQIGQTRSATWKWERGVGNGDLDYDHTF